ncbi:cyanophycin metabolism-associated DUF1854 family protein [Chitinimonas koreensis]|uniref:cyanophycin metabolism-associated DUF1854 family protein n=1 Tax=Chitinimonas koreensis TaxID=356302 RepID=UPI0004213565|nr:DUF1854 domain-containing protein [Chitinimonas koreensis]QNM97226.1 DUF1854 domain-containing protein [Chitinimonas koreensis]
MTITLFELTQDDYGRLIFTGADGVAHVGITPVRAFPIAAPDEGLSLMDRDGHELAWIDRPAELPAAQRTLIEEALTSREFMPEIRHIRAVSTFATPSNWTVDTDRGETTFILKGEEDIRRIHGGLLLIADSHGIQFLIRDLYALDRHSRRLLDRFL